MISCHWTGGKGRRVGAEIEKKTVDPKKHNEEKWEKKRKE